jgi:hypothetical protein
MVMTELEGGDGEGVCAETRGTIAATIRVTILERRDRIVVLSRYARIVEGVQAAPASGSNSVGIKCTQSP